MKSITFDLGGKLRSVGVPKESAAWLQLTDYKAGQSVIIIRMKKISEPNALVSFNNAKKENPSPAWKQLSALQYTENRGGVPDEENPYYKITFLFRNNDWNMLVDDAMLEFKQAQRDTLALGAPLPQTAQTKSDEVKSIVEALAKVGGNPNRRWK